MARKKLRHIGLCYFLAANFDLPTLNKIATMMTASMIKKAYLANVLKMPQATIIATIQATRYKIFFDITYTQNLNVNF